MRVHISLDEETVRLIDEWAGDRGRSRFIREAVMEKVDDRRKLERFKAAFGSIPDFASHLPPDWVRRSRRGQPIEFDADG